MYWSPDVETASPDKIRRGQDDALRQALRRAATVPHYQTSFGAAGLDLEQVRTTDDLVELPFFDKSELRTLQPWGVRAAGADVVRYNATTGTTGLPCNIAFSRTDLAAIGELGARNLTAMGVRASDVAWQSYGYGLWIAGSSLDRAYEQVGVTSFPGGPGRTSLAIERLRDLGVTVISCTPTFALVMIERAREFGLDPAKDWSLRIGIFGGEPTTPAALQRMTDALPPGFQPHITYGTTELGGPFVAGTCEYSREQGTFHVWADHHFIEIIHPESGQRITEPGVEGELVVTTLQREASPMLRWRTRDLTAWADDSDACPCGRIGHPKIRWISGRSDDVVKVRGSLVMPSQVEDVVCSIPSSGGNWLLVVDKDRDGLRPTEATVVLELPAEADPSLAALVASRLADRLGIKIPVAPVGVGTLPRFEGKARRVVSPQEFAELAPAAASEAASTL